MPAPYISVAEARDWLKLPDTSEDALLAVLVQVATEQLVEEMGQDIALGPTTETVRGLGGTELYVRRSPVVSASTVSWGGSSFPAEAADDVVRRADRGFFPRGEDVTVSYTAGYAAIPETVKLACRLQVAALWNAPGFNPNVAQETIGGVQSAAFGPAGPAGLAPATARLVGRYKRRWVVL